MQPVKYAASYTLVRDDDTAILGSLILWAENISHAARLINESLGVWATQNYLLSGLSINRA